MRTEKTRELLPHDWTKTVNGVFIWLVIISHFGILNGLNEDSGSYYAWQLKILGQLIVTTFLFFSGYGLMVSIQRNQEQYLRELLLRRLPRFWLTFAACVILYAGVKVLLGMEVSMSQMLVALTGWGSMGPPSWYVFMVLLEYVLIWLVFRILGQKGGARPLIILAITTMGVVYLLGEFKPRWWYNTILCMPAGMCFAWMKDKVQYILNSHNAMVWIVIAGLVLGGHCIHFSAYRWGAHSPVLKYYAGSIMANAGAVCFVLGIALAVASFAYRIPSPSFWVSHFLKWCGGSALIYIFMLHNLPIMVVKTFGWGESHELLSFTLCASVTLLLAFAVETLTSAKQLPKKERST